MTTTATINDPMFIHLRTTEGTYEDVMNRAINYLEAKRDSGLDGDVTITIETFSANPKT